MRIIGGKYKRRLIRPPKNLPVRPTTDLAKESLFNILQHKIDFTGTSALDLFSGTGSIAYEFASRRCDPVYAVERDSGCVRFIKQTATHFGMEQLKTVHSEVFRFLNPRTPRFDIIFADPPYQMKNLEEIPLLIFKYNLLLPGGLLIIEHPKEIDFSIQEHFVEHRKYGHVNFSFFQNTD
ncbi:MAG TPA: 16S rRNA (guanine(966)-N(2))-methyltransferase RsmD [Bacteroidetes bacterium]|nr:16S rRNA (guanine(966)-N(2))-methyltransferase RsmD [Bacteroidota bacterium]